MSQKCVSGKRIFETEALALDALIQNHIINNYRADEGPTNVYECPDCGQWHFTSKAEKHPLFDDPEIARNIVQEKRAINWERGFRRS